MDGMDGMDRMDRMDTMDDRIRVVRPGMHENMAAVISKAFEDGARDVIVLVNGERLGKDHYFCVKNMGGPSVKINFVTAPQT